MQPGSPVRRRRLLVLIIGVVLVFGIAVGAMGMARGRRSVSSGGEKSTSMMGKGPMAGVGPGSLLNPLARYREDMLQVEDIPSAPLPATTTGRFSEVGKVPCPLAVVSDTHTGQLLIARPEGEILLFDSSSLAEVGVRRLERTAYQLLIDPQRRQLCAATVRPGRLVLGSLGDRESAVGDLDVYDLDALLQGDPMTPQKPRQRLELGAHVTSLLLSPWGDSLFYLAESPQSGQIGRITFEDWKRDAVLPLRGGSPMALALAPDAPLLYALAEGRVFVVDLIDWRMVHPLNVGSTVLGLLAGPNCRLYLVERRRDLQLILIDFATRKTRQIPPLARWHSEIDGRPYLRASGTEGRMYLGTSAVTDGRILAIEETQDNPLNITVTTQASGNRQGLLRGPLFVTNDGKFLLRGSGQVFSAF